MEDQKQLKGQNFRLAVPRAAPPLSLERKQEFCQRSKKRRKGRRKNSQRRNLEKQARSRFRGWGGNWILPSFLPDKEKYMKTDDKNGRSFHTLVLLILHELETENKRNQTQGIGVRQKMGWRLRMNAPKTQPTVKYEVEVVSAVLQKDSRGITDGKG